MSSKQILSFTLGLAALLPIPAANADDDKIGEVALELTRFDNAIDFAPASPGDKLPRLTDPARCFAAIKTLGELGARPSLVIAGRSEFLFKQAPDRCKEYEAYVHLMRGAAVLDEASSTLRVVNGFEPGKVGKVWTDKAAAVAKACTAGVDAAVAAGAPTDVKAWVASPSTGSLAEITLPEGAKTICEPLAGWGQGYTEASAKAKTAGDAALREKYGKYGIKGDRFKLFVEYDDVYWRGKGCEVVDDLRRLAKAPVLFHWLENSGGTHTIRRYQFKGDKLVKTTNKTFKTEAAAYRGCK